MQKIVILFALFLTIGITAFFFKPTRGLIITSYNYLRPHLLPDGGEACIGQMNARGIIFTHLGDIRDGSCQIKNATRISKFSNTKINGKVTLSCQSAVKVDNWLKSISASSIQHIGAYNCRTQRTSSLISEHGYGTAIDITAINGALVGQDWRRPTLNGKILEKAFIKACEHFTNVVGPDDNSLHANHFHLDTGLGLGCHLKLFTSELPKKIQTIFGVDH